MRPTPQQRLEAIPSWVRNITLMVFFLPALALAGYWWWTYRGLYQWLAEVQIYLTNHYFPVYTGLATLIICTAIAGILWILFLNFLVFLNLFSADPTQKAQSEPANGEAGSPTEGTEERPDTAKANPQEQESVWHWILLLFGVFALFAGGFMVYSGWTAGERTTPDLAELQAGIAPPSRYVHLDGQLLSDLAVSFGETKTTRIDQTYIPVVSKDWAPDKAVAVFVRINDLRKGVTPSPVLEGLLDSNDLPGPVRVAFERMGLSLANPYFVLSPGKTPGGNLQMGLGLMGVGGVLLLLAAGVWVIIRIRQRRRPPQQSKLSSASNS